MSLTIAIPPHSRTPAPPADRAREWLARLPALDLDPFAPAHAGPAAGRRPAETAAAARAAACPDLFVIHAPDPATGELVIAEVARVCEPAGRVLVLSPDPAAADRIVERLVRGGCAGVVRALAEDENPCRPSPLVGRATSAAVLASRVERLPREADGAVAAADARLAVIERLVELAGRVARLDAEAADLAARGEAVAAAVRTETGTDFTRRLDALAAESAAAGARLEGELRAASAARAGQAGRLASLRSELADAVAGGAKKSGFFSRLLGAGKRGPDPAALDKQIREAEADVAALDARQAELQARVDGLAAALAADREKLTGEETGARRGEIDARLAGIAAGRRGLVAEAEALARSVGADSPSLDELAGLRDAATRDLLAARDHAAEANRAAPELARRALVESRVVVGTPGSVRTDPVFDRDDAGPAPPFDLLVLDRAEELTEHDFVQLARFAARWVLVGDVPPVEEPRAQVNGAAARRGPSRNGRPVPFASRLARALDRETWGYEADRLVCRLSFPKPDRRPAMTREPLLDRPEIELRFVGGDGDEPVLAEVAFPAGTAVAAARSFLFHQLGEVLLRPCGPVHWVHTPATIAATWPAAEHGADAEWIDLEPGVREKIVGRGLAAFTAAVEFDPASGWDADAAAAWLEAHTPGPSASRFAALPATSPVSRRHA